MAVLVTGATGFVGSWLVRSLVKRGESVHVLHRPNSSLNDFTGLDLVPVEGDVTDADSVTRAVRGVETVYHLAGVVGYSRAARAEMERVNVGGTRHLIDAIRANGSKADLVYLSSVVAVGASFDGHPLNENSPYNLHALNLGYFETKKAAEDLVLESARRQHIRAVTLNPSTIYGAGDAKKGSRATQLKVARGRLPFYTRGGVSVVSVHDVVDAICVAREKGRSGERYILAGENLTIQKLFELIAARANVPPPHIYLPDAVAKGIGRVGDWLERMGRKGPLNSENAWTAILFHWFEHAKARETLGFNPRPAIDAINESVDWIQQQGLLQK